MDAVSGVLAAPEGINRLAKVIPRSNIVIVEVDLGLDERNFIAPGLGDYGDTTDTTERKTTD